MFTEKELEIIKSKNEDAELDEKLYKRIATSNIYLAFFIQYCIDNILNGKVFSSSIQKKIITLKKELSILPILLNQYKSTKWNSSEESKINYIINSNRDKFITFANQIYRIIEQ